jgi:hypothetical protein
MKSYCLCGAILMAAMGGRAADLTVCLETRALVNHFMIERAKLVTVKIFSDAGLRIEWGTRARCANDPRAIYVEIDTDGPARYEAGVLAYALPYGELGARIHVFYERVTKYHSERTAPLVLGHVMAHEIGHVLEGVVRHSERGLMKAMWTARDYFEMENTLRFAPEDVTLLQLGLKTRAAR